MQHTRRVEVATRDRRLHRAARLLIVRAVVEPALGRERLDVGEREAQAGVGNPERDRAQSRRVDEHATVGEKHELARGRSVPTALIASPHLSGCLYVGTYERVHERRFADARRADQRDRAPGSREPAELVDADARDCTGHDHRRARSTPLDRGEVDRVGVHEVGLREHDHRIGAALEGEHELALEAAEVRAVLEGLGEEDGVDVGGHDLGVARGAVHGIATHEGRSTRQHGRHDRRLVAVGHEHPVAGRNRCRTRIGPHGPVRGDHAHDPAVDPRDPPRNRRDPPVGHSVGRRRGPALVPPDGNER